MRMARNGNGYRHISEPTLKEQGFYMGRTWRRCRKLALQRDNYLCQSCLRQGRTTVATEVHHIIPLEQRRDLALSIDNLMSLCHECHEATKRARVEAPAGVRVIKA